MSPPSPAKQYVKIVVFQQPLPTRNHLNIAVFVGQSAFLVVGYNDTSATRMGTDTVIVLLSP